jgi:hypothetical protein
MIAISNGKENKMRSKNFSKPILFLLKQIQKLFDHSNQNCFIFFFSSLHLVTAGVYETYPSRVYLQAR